MRKMLPSYKTLWRLLESRERPRNSVCRSKLYALVTLSMNSKAITFCYWIYSIELNLRKGLAFFAERYAESDLTRWWRHVFFIGLNSFWLLFSNYWGSVFELSPLSSCWNYSLRITERKLFRVLLSHRYLMWVFLVLNSGLTFLAFFNSGFFPFFSPFISTC